MSKLDYLYIMYTIFLVLECLTIYIIVSIRPFANIMERVQQASKTLVRYSKQKIKI